MWCLEILRENIAVEERMSKSHLKRLGDFSLQEGSFCGTESVSTTGRLMSEPFAAQRT